MKLDGNYWRRLPPIAWSRWFPGRLCPWLALVAALLASDRLEAAVIYVQPSGADAQAGTSWPTAKRSFTAALTVAHAGDEIWVAGSYYFAASGTLWFGDGQSTSIATIQLKTHVAAPATAAFSVRLENPAHGAALGDPAVVRVTLVSSPSVVTNPWNVPATWIEQHGLTLTETSGADGDGFLDRFEYFAGTDPRLKSSLKPNRHR